MRAEDALILSKRFTRDTAEGGGAVKGKDGFSPTVSIQETEDGHAVTITDAAGPHTFEVKNGAGLYKGDYAVTPKAFASQSLATAQKVMGEDVLVAAIPYVEEENASAGLTAIIGDSEVNEDG